MFESLGSFSVFFFTCATLIALAVYYENKLVALVERFDAWREARKLKNKNN